MGWLPTVAGSSSGGVVGETARVTRQSSAQSVTSSTHTLIQFDTEVLDDNGMVDLGTNNDRITIQTAGRYLIVGAVQYAFNVNNNREANFWINGTAGTRLATNRVLTAGSAATVCPLVCIASLSASDYVSLGAFQDSGGNLNAGGDVRTFLAVVRLGNLLGSGSELTISGGAVTVTQGFHTIDTESDAATDDLDTINGAQAGQLLVLKSAADARDPTLKDGTGNLRLAGDFTLTTTDDSITLIYDGTNWCELSRSDNA